MFQPGIARLVTGTEKVGAGRPGNGCINTFCCTARWQYANAIDRAGRNAQFTAGAQCFDDRVHLLGGANDCIHRAGLNAFGTADAERFVDEGDRFGLELSDVGIKRDNIAVSQVGKRMYGFIAPGRAAIDTGIVGSDGFGVRAAIRITAALALGLRQ